MKLKVTETIEFTLDKIDLEEIKTSIILTLKDVHCDLTEDMSNEEILNKIKLLNNMSCEEFIETIISCYDGKIIDDSMRQIYQYILREIFHFEDYFKDIKMLKLSLLKDSD